MSTVLTKDAEFSDNHFDITKSEKRLVRVATKTYEQTGAYIFLKLFKRENKDSEFQFSQKITLTHDEFQSLIDRVPKVKRMINNSTKPKKVDRILASKGKTVVAKKRKAEEDSTVAVTELK